MTTDDHDAAHISCMNSLRRAARRLRASMSRTQPLACQEMVELVTAYLEGALDPTTQFRFEEHLRECEGCATYLDELRATVATLGTIRVEHLDPVFRSRLLAAFEGTSGSW